MTHRSHQASHILEDSRRQELEALACEGYRFYATESEEFAAASAAAVSEALSVDNDASDQWRPLLPMNR